MNDQNLVFQDEADPRQAEMSAEQDQFLAELVVRNFLIMAERGLTSATDVEEARNALRTLGVKI